jgi:hypothetical protein
MKFKLFNTALAGIILFANATANAGLILTITDNGSNQTLWEFSGSTLASSPISSAVGFWPEFGYPGPIGQYQGCGNILSGSGTMYTTNNGTVGITEACIYESGEFTAFKASSLFNWQTNDTLSWSGSIVTDISITHFKSGVYQTKQSRYSNDDVFLDPVVLTIGSQNNITDVPEPSTLAIFALGMIGLASRRFKKQ